jgi:hypothetical protein
MHTSGQSPMPTLRVIDPLRARRQRWTVIGIWFATVVLAYVVGRYVMIPDAGGLSAQLDEARATLSSTRDRLADVEQRLAVVERAEQIARLANENVQSALASKDSEIASLRRDRALYDRLIGPDAVRQGLAVFELELRPATDGSVGFIATLTQTRDVRSGSKGRLTVAVDGQRGGQLERLDWPQLAAAGEEGGIDYDFRYFQRLEGRFMLPDGFQPHTVRVNLKGSGDDAVERSWSWEQVVKQGVE